MLPLQSVEVPAPPNTAEENGEKRQQKPKTLPCQYCSKRFRRVEHVQRHERTHTKEKPFACTQDRCGKSFGRRDLLVRHEKLVHLSEGNKDGSRPRKTSSGTVQAGPSDSRVDTEMLDLQQQQQRQQQQHRQQHQQQRAQAPLAPHPPASLLHQMPLPSPHYNPAGMSASVASSLPLDPRLQPRPATACNLDLLSDAATHLASAGEANPSPMQPMIPELAQPPAGLARVKAYDEGMSFGDRGREQDPTVLSGGYAGQAPAASNSLDALFMEGFGSSSSLLPPLETEQSMGMWSRTAGDMQGRGGPLRTAAPSFPSTRFPSVQPNPRDASEGDQRLPDEVSRIQARVIFAPDHKVIKNRLDEFSSVLPPDFVFPSRHTLTRFIEGYIGGFHEHLPFLHIPTLSPTDLSPELLLAIAAVGALYRFETHRGHALWYAAKAVAFEQIRRRHSHEVHGLLPTPAAYSPHSTRPSPSSALRHSFNSAPQDRPITQDTHREPYSPNTPQSRLETIQALLLLFAVGLWDAKAILHEALSLQSQLALLIREEGLMSDSTEGVADWETWIRMEGSTRTKLIAYCFFNLCNITYNTPPMLMTSEMNMLLPNPSRLWRADGAWHWQDARQSYPAVVEVSLQDAFAQLLNRNSPGDLTSVSSLGFYVLMHAIIQHIYLLRQTSFAAFSPFEVQRSLKEEDVEQVSRALLIWQTSLEQHAGLSGVSDGPVAFNSTALLRLAYIRLFTDLTPTRMLQTRDHILIANGFVNIPLLVRNHGLTRVLYQAVHALSRLVKDGVNYVARTKSPEWSMQYSLSNMESAVLLSKWLMTLALLGPNDSPASNEERDLLGHIGQLLDETEFAVPIDPSLSGSASGRVDPPANDSTKLRQLAAAVIRLWAETFKGNHVFDMVRIIGLGLEAYAHLIEKPGDRTPLGRMAPADGLG